MAREHANIRLDMIGDADWRTLSVQAQWLYKLLLVHPKTNRAGVSDWRPNRLASIAAGVSAADVREYAAELERGHFVVIDEDNEEILVRTYVKHDGVMKQPNMAVTMANDWSGVASERIRAVVAFEVQKLRRERPDLPGWKSERHLETILAAPTLDVKNDPRPNPSVYPSIDPTVNPSNDPSVDPSVKGRTTTTTTATSPKGDSGAAKRGTRIPDNFHITEPMRNWAREETPLVDPDRRLPEFIDYWRGVPGAKGVKLDWVSTWRNDMRKKQEFAERDQKRTTAPDPNAWMARTEIPAWKREQ